MAENPLRNRRRGQSPDHQLSPTSASPEFKEEEEVIWGKTPGGEGKLEIVHHPSSELLIRFFV